MAENINEVRPFVREMLDEQAVLEAVTNMSFTAFGRVKKLEKNQGDTVRFYKVDLGEHTTEVAQTDNLFPNGRTISSSTIDARLYEYSQVWYIAKRDMAMHQEDYRKNLGKGVGKKMGKTIENVTANTILANASVVYAGGVSSASGITASGEVSESEVRGITAYMAKNEIEPLTEYIKSDPGYGTTPVSPSYVGLIPVSAVEDYRSLDNFEDVEIYQTKAGEKLLPGEFGRIKRANVRLVSVPDYLVESGAGGDGCDVYTSVFIGEDAYAFTPFETDPKKVDERYCTQVITHETGALNRFMAIGYVTNFAAAVLRDEGVICYRHPVSSASVTVVAPS